MSRRARWWRAERVLVCVMLSLPVSLSSAARASGQTLLPPDPAKTVGKVVSFDGFVDENGRAFSTLPASGERPERPWIVSPMYTRCVHSCSAVTTALHRALGRSGLDPSAYRVVSFSFDPSETADSLRAFRARLRLPPEWLTLRARDPATIARTLEQLDFHTITLGDGQFEHPNLVGVLDPKMRLAGYVFGVNFSPAELARTVRRARAGISALDSWRTYLFVVAALGFLASAALFVALLSRQRARAKTSHPLPATDRV